MTNIAEKEDDKINLKLMHAITSIKNIFTEHGDQIRPWEAAQIVELFVLSVNYLTDLDPERLAEEFVELRGLSNDAIGQLILGIPLEEATTHDLDRHLAVDVARVIGPDHAQNWYRFAVLMTKLA